jgi:CubicO group peptidase (beta-lactamase class C family)
LLEKWPGPPRLDANGSRSTPIASGHDRAGIDARYRTYLAEGRRVGDRSSTPLPASALQEALDHGRRGALAGVHVDGKGDWYGASGRADPTKPAKLDPNARFRIGSISKTFVATLAMQQAEKGQLNLDDKINKWFPNFPKANDSRRREARRSSSSCARTSSNRSA